MFFLFFVADTFRAVNHSLHSRQESINKLKTQVEQLQKDRDTSQGQTEICKNDYLVRPAENISNDSFFVCVVEQSSEFRVHSSLIL